jgi:hypothetical protein
MLQRAAILTQWHFLIPFYYGVNRHVTGRGGAPVSRKVSFLTQTVETIARRVPGAEIIVAVCDAASENAAAPIVPTVARIDCLPRHLPYATVKFAAQRLSQAWSGADIVVFNEDDQPLYLSDNVRKDIERRGDEYFFSPHRWNQGGGERRFRAATRFQLEGRDGIIDNVFPDCIGRPYQFNCAYRSQHTRLSAYAACWATHCSSLCHLNFTPYENNPETICLVLKPDLAEESPEIFLADHLSGRNYFKRRFSLKRLLHHVKRMKF